jgi:hypothetical protein
MPSIIKPIASPLAVVVLRTLLYLAILGAVWAVSDITAAAAPPFIYQGF